MRGQKIRTMWYWFLQEVPFCLETGFRMLPWKLSIKTSFEPTRSCGKWPLKNITQTANIEQQAASSKQQSLSINNSTNQAIHLRKANAIVSARSFLEFKDPTMKGATRWKHLFLLIFCNRIVAVMTFYFERTTPVICQNLIDRDKSNHYTIVYCSNDCLCKRRFLLF